MSQLEPQRSRQEEVFEWVLSEDKKQWEKITSKNSNGRKCTHCGCNCPCRCKCCQKGCCTYIHKDDEDEK